LVRAAASGDAGAEGAGNTDLMAGTKKLRPKIMKATPRRMAMMLAIFFIAKAG
jgi:hypothetical protein